METLGAILCIIGLSVFVIVLLVIGACGVVFSDSNNKDNGIYEE
jgi:hypothetical protein